MSNQWDSTSFLAVQRLIRRYDALEWGDEDGVRRIFADAKSLGVHDLFIEVCLQLTRKAMSARDE